MISKEESWCGLKRMLGVTDSPLLDHNVLVDTATKPDIYIPAIIKTKG